MNLASHGLAATFSVLDGIDRQQRSFSLHVMHISWIVDSGIAHGGAHALGDLLDHRRPADILRQQLRTRSLFR